MRYPLFALFIFASGVIEAQNPPMHHHNMPGMKQPDQPDPLEEDPGRPAMQLAQFEEFALKTNPTLLQANALVKQSAGQARQAGLLPNPTVGYQGEQLRGGSYGGGENGAFVQQNFVLGGKLGLRREVYEQQRREREIAVTEQRHRVLSDVGRRFYAALAQQEMVKLRRRLLAVAMDAVETAHQLANVGQADAPDVLQAEVEGEQAQLELARAQRRYIREFRGLADLAGKSELPLAPLAGDLENPPQIDAAGILNHIVENSPSVKRARQGLLRSEAELKSARRESVPDLQIRGGVQQNSEQLNAFARPVGLQAFATIGVTLPLFNRNQGGVAAANADLERAGAEVARMQLSLRESAQPLLQAYLSDRLEADRYKTEMIPRAARAYQMYLAKYREMAAAYPQVIVSQRTLFQLQVAYIDALRDLWSNAIALRNYTLTGGLDALMPSGGIGSSLNPPTSAGGVQ